MLNRLISLGTIDIMSIHKKLKSILDNNAFEELSAYVEPKTWDHMSEKERELLGILFVKQGEHQLTNGDARVTQSFDLASKISPHNPAISFAQAMVYASYGQSVRCLVEACKGFEKTTEIDPHHLGSWHSWGNVLVSLGIINDNISSFYQADEKFAQVEKHAAPSLSDAYLADLNWHWGVCWLHIGKHSGEAVDFAKALEKFRIAKAKGCDEGEFHNDFGNVLVDLGCLLSRKDFFDEATLHFRKYTKLVPKRFEGWLNLATCNHKLYDYSNETKYFHEADECYEKAIALSPNEANIWFGWAELYINSGKNTRDLERISASFEKLERAYTLEPHSPHVLLSWGEAQLFLSINTENLDLLREAERKIQMATEANRDNPEAWYIYGACLSEYGRYFSEEKYYYQAIEKFQIGLGLDPTNPLLLHGLGLAHFSIGEMNEDILMIEKSLEFCSSIAETQIEQIPHFLCDWGIALMKLGQLSNDKTHIEAAAEKFEKAINQHFESSNGEPIELEWLYNYGCAMDYLGDFHEESIYYDKAIQVFSHILSVDQQNQQARYHLALAHFHLGELNGDVFSFNNAIDLFHEVVQNDSEDEVAWNDYGMALLNLAVLTKDPGLEDESHRFFEQAEVKFQQAAALGNLSAFYNLACLYALTNNVKAAVHFLDKAESCNVLPAIAEVLHDEWLESLQDEPAFKELISRLINKRMKEEG